MSFGRTRWSLSLCLVSALGSYSQLKKPMYRWWAVDVERVRNPICFEQVVQTHFIIAPDKGLIQLLHSQSELPEILGVQGLFGEKELVRDAETGRKGAYAGITFIRLKFLKSPKLSKLQKKIQTAQPRLYQKRNLR